MHSFGLYSRITSDADQPLPEVNDCVGIVHISKTVVLLSSPPPPQLHLPAMPIDLFLIFHYYWLLIMMWYCNLLFHEGGVYQHTVIPFYASRITDDVDCNLLFHKEDVYILKELLTTSIPLPPYAYCLPLSTFKFRPSLTETIPKAPITLHLQKKSTSVPAFKAFKLVFN